MCLHRVSRTNCPFRARTWVMKNIKETDPLLIVEVQNKLPKPAVVEEILTCKYMAKCYDCKQHVL